MMRKFLRPHDDSATTSFPEGRQVKRVWLTARDKVVALLVFGAGLAAGLYNWYLMDPGFFGR